MADLNGIESNENKQIYHYDIFNESDIHCDDCRFLGDRYGFQPFCAKSGKVVQRVGYCNLAERRKEEKSWL